jgi:hypothetical protein
VLETSLDQSTMLSTSLTSLTALLASQVAAHGAVTSYNIAGKDYAGYFGFDPSNDPVIQWQWPNYDPSGYSCATPQIRCNGGTSAALSATAAPGDAITAIWEHWVHTQGPILVWMYKCPNDFSTCTGSGSGWFKIDEAGFHGDGTSVFLDSDENSGWDIAELVGSNKSWTSTVPAGLVPGNYLVRHELIALHYANSPQFYAECAQIQVTGSGNASPSSSQLASIPGYCSDSDKNIKVYACPLHVLQSRHIG